MAENESKLKRWAELVTAVAGAIAVVCGSAWWVFSAVVLAPIQASLAKIDEDIARIESRIDRSNESAATANNEVRGAIGDTRTTITEIASRLDAVRVRLAERDRRPEPEPTRVVIRELPDRMMAGIRRTPGTGAAARVEPGIRFPEAQASPPMAPEPIEIPANP